MYDMLLRQGILRFLKDEFTHYARVSQLIPISSTPWTIKRLLFVINTNRVLREVETKVSHMMYIQLNPLITTSV